MLKNKFNILVLVFLLLGPLGLNAANRWWIATTSTDWNSMANWSSISATGAGGATVPLASDIAIFTSNRLGSCTINTNVSVAGIDVQTGYTGTISQGAFTITIGANNASFVGGTFTGGSATIVCNGSFTLNGTSFTSTTSTFTLNSIVVNTSGTFTHNSGTVVFGGTGAQTIPAWNFYTLTLSGARTTNNITLVNGTIGVAGAFSSTASFTTGDYIRTGNTIAYNGGSSQTVGAFIYNNISFSGYHDIKNITFPNGGTVTVRGTFTNTATFSTGNFIMTGNTVDYNGTTAQTVAAFRYNNLMISGARTTASVTLASTGTITIEGIFSTPATFTSGNYINTGSTINYNTTGPQSIIAFNYNNLTIAGSRTVYNVTLAGSGTIGVAGTLTHSASYTIGALVVTGSTVDFKGASQLIPNLVPNYNNLTCSGTGNKTASADLTVNGVLTINSGRILAMSTFKLNGASITTSGTGTLVTSETTATPIPSGKTWSFTVEYNGASTQTAINGTYANYTMNNSANSTGQLTVNGLLTIASGKTLNIQTNKLIGATLTTSGTGTFQTGELTTTPIPSGRTWSFTVEYNGASAQSAIAGTYANCTFTQSATATGAMTVNGLLTIPTTKLLTMSTFKLSGATLTTSGTGTLQTAEVTTTPIPSGRTWSFTVEYNGATAQSAIAGTYANATFTQSATATGAFTVSGLLSIPTTKILTMSTFKLSGAALTTSGTGTLRTAELTSTPIPSGRTWSFTVEYNGASVQSAIAGTYTNCTFTQSGNATGAITVNGVLSIASTKVLNMFTNKLSGAALTTTGTGTLQTAETTTTPIPSGRTWSFTVLYNGVSTQSAIAGTYANYTMNNSANATGAIAVTSLLTIANTKILDMQTNKLTGAALTTSGTGTLQTAETTTTPIPSGRTWSFSVLYNGASPQTTIAGTYSTNYTMSNNSTATGAITVNGILTIDNTKTLTMSTFALSGAALTTSGTGTLQTASTTALPTGRTWSFTVVLNGTVAQTVSLGTYSHLTITGAHTTTSVTLASGTITVLGNYTNSATYTSGALITTTNTMLFSGTTNQFIIGGANSTFEKLQVNKTTGKVYLNTIAIVKKQLILTRGIVRSTAANYLQQDLALAADTVLGASDSSYVSGPYRKVGNLAFTFPLGDTTLATGAYHPLKISAPANATYAYTAQYFAKNVLIDYPGYTAIETDSLESVSDCEYWLLTQSIGTVTAVTPTLGWNTNSCNIQSFFDLRVVEYDGTMWKSKGNGGAGMIGNLGTLKGTSGLTLSPVPIMIGLKRLKNKPYALVKKQLDGGFYLPLVDKIYFKFDGEYNLGTISYTVTDNSTGALVSVPSINTTVRNYGDNRYELNLAGTLTPSSKYYTLEVVNEKNVSYFLKFKY